MTADLPHPIFHSGVPEVDWIIQQLQSNIQAVLGDDLVGLYLDGSLTRGDFDQDSDIDFVAVTSSEVTPDGFLALQAMHDRLKGLDNTWAARIDCTYISSQALRRHDPALARHPTFEWGPGERLKWVDYDQSWDVHRYVLRERGITLIGPDPRTLIDPHSPGQMRHAMHPVLADWLPRFLANPALVSHPGNQSYIVLCVCRILYTLETGDVASKPLAARWAVDHLDQRWSPLIKSAWQGRHNPDLPATPDELEATLALIRYTIDQDKAG